MATLRSPEGCPWDREQSPETLRPFLLEETYEAIEAIDRGDHDDLKGELGDVMFQCVFQAQIAFEAGRFDIADSLDHIAAKLIRRHPHVFTSSGTPLGRRARGGSAPTPQAVLEQWEVLKAREQADAGREERLLSGVPRALPSLARAYEIGTRVAAVGFDWPHVTDVIDKIDEEARELRGALEENPSRVAEEFGDLLFSLANLARKLGVDPESALRAANDKFTTRFSTVEDVLKAEGSSVHKATLEEMEAAWQKAKSRALAPGPSHRTTSKSRSRSSRAPASRRSRSQSRRRGRS